jgi:hypothetical protein
MIAIAAVVVTVLLPVAVIALLGQPANDREEDALGRSGPAAGADTGDDAAVLDGSTTTSAGTSSGIPSTDDLALASAAVVSEDHLPAGWLQCCPDQVFAASELGQHICGSSDGLPPHTAGFQRQFALNLTISGAEDGHLVHTILIAPTEADAIREFQAIDAPGYGPCAEESVARSAALSVPVPVTVADVSFERSALPDGAPGIVDRFTTVFDTAVGPEVVYTSFVRMQQGRAIVRMPITTYATSLSDADLQPLVAAATQTLQEALD